MTQVEHIMLNFLTAAQQSLIAATTPGTPEAEFRWNVERATLAGMCAYLLDALHTNDQGEADEVAVALERHCADGEPLADWVAEELNRRGVEVESMIQQARVSAERSDPSKSS